MVRMRHRQRVLVWLVCILYVGGGIPCRALECRVSASSAIVLDAQSGRVLYEKNADAKMLIASTTKIMTALLAIEHGGLQETVKVKREWTQVEGSSLYLREGEELTLETLLYGLLLCSGNDAAVAIAGHCGGSVEAFVEQMNAKAQELGMTQTSFANPNGLDHEEHYSTARDMARLAAYAMENETLARMVSTKTIRMGGRTMSNHNKLLQRLDGCTGLKTGYTRAAGRTLVTSCERKGQRLIAVTLQAPDDWTDHSTLYELAFDTYPQTELVRQGQTARMLPVRDGALSRVPVLCGDSFFYPLEQGESVELRLELESSVRAPVTAGEAAGEAVVTLDGVELGRVALVYGSSSPAQEKERQPSLWERLLAKG